MLFTTIAITTLVAVHAGTTKLGSFDGSKGLTFPWQVLNDPVMGGSSTSSFKIENNLGVFNGTCAIVKFLKAPGFAKITTKSSLFKPNVFNDVSEYLENGFFQVRAKTTTPDFKGFKVAFAAKHIPRTSMFGGGSFKADVSFTKKDEFEIISVPFNKFSYDWSPYTGECSTKDPTGQQHHCCSKEDNYKYCPTAEYLKTITDLEFWAEGSAGDFHVEIDWFGAGN